MSDTNFQVQMDGELPFRLTSDREAAKADDQVSLLGLEHPLVKQLLDENRQLTANARALVARKGTIVEDSLRSGISTDQRYVQKIIPIGLDDQGKRSKSIEIMVPSVEKLTSALDS